MKKATRENYRKQKWFCLENLTDFIAEYNKDGKYDHTAWEFWYWLDRKCKPKRNVV